MEPTTLNRVEALRFDEVSGITPTAPGQYRGEVSPEWTIAAKPNGGYLLAMLARGALGLTEHRHVLAASAHYLRSPDPGPVTIDVELLRGGRSASQVRARLSQDGRTCIEALITATDLDGNAKPFWDGGVPRPGDAAWEDCVRLPAVGPGGFPVAIADQAEIRLDPRSMGFAAGRPAGRGELHGWLALPHGEAFDPVSLLYAVDAFPPATFDVEPSGWMPTLELTVYIRALPAPGPVRVLHRAQLVDGGWADEECYVWDRHGRLAAQGRQLAAIRFS